jgi:hypothetical protein
MRLTELEPRWYGRRTPEGVSGQIGVTFDCPVHRRAHKCFVPFVNPIDGGPPEVRKHLWQRTGDTFETLTLTPSVDYTKYDNGTLRDASCWHGFITNGDVS